MRARLSRLALASLASFARVDVCGRLAAASSRLHFSMGVCVSVHTVERVLADEAEIERERRVERFTRSLDANDGRLILHGLLARADRVNRNQRIYPKSILQREVAAYDAGAVREGRAYGRLEHPSEAEESLFRDVSERGVASRDADVLGRRRKDALRIPRGDGGDGRRQKGESDVRARGGFRGVHAIVERVRDAKRREGVRG